MLLVYVSGRCLSKIGQTFGSVLQVEDVSFFFFGQFGCFFD